MAKLLTRRTISESEGQKKGRPKREKSAKVKGSQLCTLHMLPVTSLLVSLASLFVPFAPLAHRSSLLPTLPTQPHLPPTSTWPKAQWDRGPTEVSVSRAGCKATGRTRAQSSTPQRDRISDQACNHLSPPVNQEKAQEQASNRHSKELEVKYDHIINFDDEKCDYEQGSSTKFQKGSLRANLSYWRKIEASDFVLDVVANGYKLPFIIMPKRQEFKNNKSAIIHSDFVTSSILELLDSRRIVELHSRPHIVNPLSVSSNKDKNRLILDLRYVNRHLERQKVRFEDWKVFQNYLISDGFLFKFDLKSGYHHIEINRDYQTYLGFSWKF